MQGWLLCDWDNGWLHCVCESRLLLCTCDSGWLRCACDDGWMFYVCDGSWDCPWSISGWERPMNYDWVWPLAVGFFFYIFFYSFSAAFYLFLIWYLAGYDRTEGKPPGRQQGSLPPVRVVQLSVTLGDDIWFFFHDRWATPKSFWNFQFNSLKFCFQKKAILNVYLGYI